jgi:hypothetical protein
MNKQHVGGDFDDFLREQRLLEMAEAAATKRVIAYQIAEEMKSRKLIGDAVDARTGRGGGGQEAEGRALVDRPFVLVKRYHRR